MTQLEAIYDYMAKNGKTIKQKRTCRLCKKTDTEFHGHNNVCKTCWNDYVKLTKYEKRMIR